MKNFLSFLDNFCVYISAASLPASLANYHHYEEKDIFMNKKLICYDNQTICADQRIFNNSVKFDLSDDACTVKWSQ